MDEIRIQLEISHLAANAVLCLSFQLILLLSAFENLAFCPAALMEPFAEKVIAGPDALTLKDILFVLKVYSSLNYDLRHQRRP